MGLIYKATCRTTGLAYIGQTIRTLSRRRCAHENRAASGSSSYFHRALRKYGTADFDWEVLYDDVANENLNAMEIECIARFDTLAPCGYNLSRGGEFSTAGLKMPKTPEHRAKIAAAQRGKNVSEETRAKLRKAWENRKVTPEQCERMRQYARDRIGKPLPEATKAKVSAAQKGKPRRPHTPEEKEYQKQKMIEYWRRKKQQ